MNLPKPIQTTINNKSVIIETIKMLIIDSPHIKRVDVKLYPFDGVLKLWENESYDIAGDYTQAQVEARILELLGDDPKSVLETLII